MTVIIDAEAGGNMYLKPMNFRTISEDSKPTFKIRTADGMPLILIKGSGEATYANARTAKDELVNQVDFEHDLLLWGWVGAWRTDIFQLTKTDIEIYYR